MKMHKRIATLSICMAIIASELTGCGQSNESIENTSAAETTIAAEITTAVKTEMPTATTTKPVMTTTKMTVIEDEFIDDGEEEIIFDGMFDISEKIYNITYDDLKIKNARFFSEGVCAFQDERTGFWGYMDTDFNVVIRPQYSDAYTFSDGLAAVYDGEKWGFIDKSGSYVISPTYSEVYYKYEYDNINSNGHEEAAIGFMDGYAVVGFGDIARYVIDTQGNIVNQFKNEFTARRYGDEIIHLCNSGYMADSKFDAISSVAYDDVSHYNSLSNMQLFTLDYAKASIDYKDTIYIIDKYGNTILELEDFSDKYSYSAITKETFTLQRKSSDNTYHTALYDYSFNEIIPYYYTSIYPLCKNGEVKYYIGYFSNDECELLDREGNILDYEWFDGSSFVGAQLCEMFGDNSDEEFMFLFKYNSVSLINVTKNEIAFEIDGYSSIPNMPEMPEFESSYSKNYEQNPLDLHTYIYNNYFLIIDEHGNGYLYGIDGEFIRTVSTEYAAWSNDDIIKYNLAEGIIADNEGTFGEIKTFMKLE